MLRRQAGQAERNDDSESRTNICHLPKPVYRIIKERALFDFEATRDLLTSALACEGFGRGGKKLRYRVPENKPSWWDDDLEQIIGLKWSDFRGVNTKEYKGGKWKEAMHEIIVKIYRYHLGNEMDNYIQFRDENFEYKKTSRKPKPKKVAASNPNQETDLPKEGVAENELYQFPDNVLQYQYQVPQTPHVQLQAPQHQAPQHQAPQHQAPVIDGCMIHIEAMEVKDEKYSQAVILNKELNLLAKDFFERVFKEKNMISEEGQRREDHPHFQNTPVFRKLRSRLAVPGGGLKCDKCEKIFKNNTTLSKHRCTN
jgi:hypothetical protein